MAAIELPAAQAAKTEEPLKRAPKTKSKPALCLPKGLVDPGEKPIDAAVREVREETGFECTLGDELATVRYVDAKGRPKRVRYWMMTVAGGAANIPNAEVDDLAWLTPGDASTLLTYAHDQTLARRLGEPR